MNGKLSKIKLLMKERMIKQKIIRVKLKKKNSKNKKEKKEKKLRKAK